MDFNRTVPIQKTDDEQRMVYGFASTPDLDSQGEVVELNALKNALPEYMKFPAIREMHQPKAAGITKETKIDEKGLFIGAKIVDNDAWKKVKEGVYRAFSIGGHIKNMVGNVIKDIDLAEISLVDRPANPKAVITVFKRHDPELHIDNLQDWEREHLNAIHKNYSLADKDTIRRVNNVIKEAIMAKDKKEPTKEVEEVKEVEEKAEVVKTEEPEVKEVKPEVEVDLVEKAQEPELLNRLAKLEEAMEKKAEVKEPEITKYESLEKGLVTVASVLEKLTARVEQLESTPAATKTKSSLVEKTFATTEENSNALSDKEQARLDVIQKRLDELKVIREESVGEFMSKYQSEANRLLDEKKALTLSF